MGKGSKRRPTTVQHQIYEERYKKAFSKSSGRKVVKNCTTCNVLVSSLKCYNCNEHTSWKSWIKKND